MNPSLTSHLQVIIDSTAEYDQSTLWGFGAMMAVVFACGFLLHSKNRVKAWVAALFLVGAGVSSGYMSVQTSEANRTEIAAANCSPVIGGIASGVITYLEKGDVRSVRNICGDAAFLAAANSPSSALAADIPGTGFQLAANY